MGKKFHSSHKIGNIFILVLIAFCVSVLYLLTQTIAGWLLLIGAGLLVCAGICFRKTPRSLSETKRIQLMRMTDVDNMSGEQFERYINYLLQHQGFETQLTPARNDYGVDIVAQRDGIRYAIQCKRYGENISRDAVSDVVAGKHYYGCSLAMVVTNRYYRKGALELAQASQCVLINRDQLGEWIENYEAAQLQQSGQGSTSSPAPVLPVMRKVALGLTGMGTLAILLSFLLFSLRATVNHPSQVTVQPTGTPVVAKTQKKRGANHIAPSPTLSPVEKEEMRRIEAGIDESQKPVEERGR